MVSLNKICSNTDFKKYNFDEKTLLLFLKSKSTSVLKKIFIISIIEFSLSIFLNLCFVQFIFISEFKNIDNQPIIIFLELLNYFIILFFIFKFYKNYIQIQLNSTVNQFNNNILISRKTVYNYVRISLVLFNLNSLVYAFIYLYEKYPLSKEIKFEGTIFEHKLFYIIFLCILSLILFLYTYFAWILYKFFYFKLIDNISLNDRELNSIDY